LSSTEHKNYTQARVEQVLKKAGNLDTTHAGIDQIAESEAIWPEDFRWEGKF